MLSYLPLAKIHIQALSSELFEIHSHCFTGRFILSKLCVKNKKDNLPFSFWLIALSKDCFLAIFTEPYGLDVKVTAGERILFRWCITKNYSWSFHFWVALMSGPLLLSRIEFIQETSQLGLPQWVNVFSARQTFWSVCTYHGRLKFRFLWNVH